MRLPASPARRVRRRARTQARTRTAMVGEEQRESPARRAAARGLERGVAAPVDVELDLGAGVGVRETQLGAAEVSVLQPLHVARCRRGIVNSGQHWQQNAQIPETWGTMCRLPKCRRIPRMSSGTGSLVVQGIPDLWRAAIHIPKRNPTSKPKLTHFLRY